MQVKLYAILLAITTILASATITSAQQTNVERSEYRTAELGLLEITGMRADRYLGDKVPQYPVRKIVIWLDRNANEYAVVYWNPDTKKVVQRLYIHAKNTFSCQELPNDDLQTYEKRLFDLQAAAMKHAATDRSIKSVPETYRQFIPVMGKPLGNTCYVLTRSKTSTAPESYADHMMQFDDKNRLLYVKKIVY